MTDLISRADAIEAVKETKPIVRSTERNWGKMIAEQHSKELVKALKALPSADAVDVAHDIPEYCSWSQTYTNMVQSAMSKASADAVQGERGIEDDKLNTCNNHSNNAYADYKSHIRGEWEHWGSPFSDESEVIDTIVCSVCGARFIEPKDEPKGEYNYCPNCGARMKGGGSE